MAGYELPIISQYLSNVNPTDFYYAGITALLGSDPYNLDTNYWRDKNNWMPNHSNVYSLGSWSLTTDRYIKYDEPTPSVSQTCRNLTFAHHISANVAGRNVTTIRYDVDGILNNATFGLSCGMISLGGNVYRRAYIGFSTRERKLRVCLWNGVSYGVRVNGAYMTDCVNTISPSVDNFTKENRNVYSLVLKISKGVIESVEPTLFINNKLATSLEEIADTQLNFSRQCHPDIGLDVFETSAFMKIKSLSLVQG